MIAGEEGECILATPDLAALAMISTGQVSESRKYLLGCGLLEGKYKRDPGYPQPVWHLRIPDIWADNLAWRKSLGDKISSRIAWKEEQKMSLHLVKPSPGDGGVTPGDGGVTPGETKNIHDRTIQEPPPFSENPAADLPLGIDGQQRAVDKANGSKMLDPVEEVVKHLWWLCMGREAHVPGKKALAEYTKAARSLLEKTDAQDWRGVCVAVDGWSENPPEDDRWRRERTKEPGFAIGHLTAYYWAGRNGKAPGRKDLEPQSYEPDFLK